MKSRICMKALTALRVRETGLIAEGIVALGVAQASSSIGIRCSSPCIISSRLIFSSSD